MRIVIIGSKPVLPLADGDAIYMANGAGSLSEHFAHCPLRVHVASRNLFNPETFISPADVARNSSVRGQHFHRSVIFKRNAENVDPKIVHNIYKTDNIEVIDQFERDSIVYKSTGLTIPFGENYYERLKYYINSRFRGGDARVNQRPTTGILSLLVAIRDHGIEANYILSRIGLADDGYIFNGEFIPSLPHELSRDGKTAHADADEAVLTALISRGYRLSTDVPELSSRFRLPQL